MLNSSSIYDATSDLIHMKNGMKQIWQYLAASIMGLLGFPSCDEIDNILKPPPMYGQPYADFKALGTVRDEDGNPVKGIQVTVRQNWRYTKPAENKLFTDTEGTFQLIRQVFDEPESITVTFEDVDGEENGGDFASAEVSPEITHTKKGDHDFYGGAFEARADVQLKKK
jgi:putative lipoprotein (rSAM/lipoprotein system)